MTYTYALSKANPGRFVVYCDGVVNGIAATEQIAARVCATANKLALREASINNEVSVAALATTEH